MASVPHRAATLSLAVAVAVAFADSSIVALALPELYVSLGTTIVGVSCVMTAYNLVVAVGVFAFAPAARRWGPARTALVGMYLFFFGSIGCGAAWDLASLLAFRCVQGLGGAVLLVGALPLFVALTGSRGRGAGAWTGAGAVGVAIGPALGGLLTELLHWRAIFAFQAPVAAAALLAVVHPRARRLEVDEGGRPALAANLALLLTFGALVGALFLSVLMVVTVWELGPLTGAGVVSALPAAALVTRRLGPCLPPGVGAAGGAVVLAGGLGALALLPSPSAALATLALALCGAGFGLVVPPLTRASVGSGSGVVRSATWSVGARHTGLVLSLALIAPILAGSLERGGERALVNATATVLDAEIPLHKKVPIALGLRDSLEAVPDGEIPDLGKPFEEAGAGHDRGVRRARESLLEAIQGPITRSFRPGFALAALFALLALLPVAIRRQEAAG